MLAATSSTYATCLSMCRLHSALNDTKGVTVLACLRCHRTTFDYPFILRAADKPAGTRHLATAVQCLLQCSALLAVC